MKTLKIGLNKRLFKKKKSATNAEILKMVPLARIGLATPSLPMTCSTTELQRRQLKVNIHILKIKIKHIF